MPIYPNTDKIEEKIACKVRKKFFSRWSTYVENEMFVGQSFA